jgi:hypothetical protein
MKLFWVSWWTDIDPFEEGIKFPFWVSGYRRARESNRDASVCALIDAKDQEDAWKKVQATGTFLEPRFCDEKPSGWTPDPGRFPMPKKRGKK